MLKPERAQKGVVLLIVLGTVLVVTVLASAVLAVVNNQTRLTHHQVSRIKAYYASLGIMNLALENLRKSVSGGGWDPHPTNYRYACFPSLGCIDGVTRDYDLPDDPDIPYKVQVKIYPQGTVAAGSPIGSGVTQIEIKTDYTYTP